MCRPAWTPGRQQNTKPRVQPAANLVLVLVLHIFYICLHAFNFYIFYIVESFCHKGHVSYLKCRVILPQDMRLTKMSFFRSMITDNYPGNY